MSDPVRLCEQPDAPEIMAGDLSQAAEYLPPYDVDTGWQHLRSALAVEPAGHDSPDGPEADAPRVDGPTNTANGTDAANATKVATGKEASTAAQTAASWAKNYGWWAAAAVGAAAAMLWFGTEREAGPLENNNEEWSQSVEYKPVTASEALDGVDTSNRAVSTVKGDAASLQVQASSGASDRKVLDAADESLDSSDEAARGPNDVAQKHDDVHASSRTTTATSPRASKTTTSLGKASPTAVRSTAPQQPALAEEVAHLASLRSMLRSDPTAALTAAAEGHRRFAGGVFYQEREAIAIDALAALGRTTSARERARAFIAQFPTSTLADRVRRAGGL